MAANNVKTVIVITLIRILFLPNMVIFHGGALGPTNRDLLPNCGGWEEDHKSLTNIVLVENGNGHIRQAVAVTVVVVCESEMQFHHIW